MLGCSSAPEPAYTPTTITLFYDDSSISAGILPDNTFDALLADRSESVAFSGLIYKRDTGYLVDISVVRQKKKTDSPQTLGAVWRLDTSVMFESGAAVEVSGLNNDIFKIVLE
ncbi:hypothetical protein [uncultured Vibrio sp.]|uniref:hypothetical protein n=1 Tax=uncultured Vibrio sp. TaxID=114054 RepID=UPI00341F4842